MNIPLKTHGISGLAIQAIFAGALSSVLLAVTITPTFSVLDPSIQTMVSHAGSGILTMQEADSTGATLCDSTDGGAVATNSATCATINAYGGNLNMVPGETVTTNITIRNTGSVPASAFTLAGGSCVQAAGSTSGSAIDMCAKTALVVRSGATTIYTGTAAGFATVSLNVNTLLASPALAPAAAVPISFSVTLDATADNTYQGLRISQPMTFTLGL